ncbi:MAG: hypothetical protein NZ585_12240 [Chloracidobacterium sp.]|nr:hypothetical protein [Chloracidobacterium sp.]MDW8216195.1 hypothetical protein [Acidobacteriota bacterium]
MATLARRRMQVVRLLAARQGSPLRPPCILRPRFGSNALAALLSSRQKACQKATVNLESVWGVILPLDDPNQKRRR